MSWPVTDAIALGSPSGRMSKRALRAAQERIRKQLFGDGLMTERKTEMGLTQIAGEVRKEMNPNLDGYQTGDLVLARFTNSGRIHEFTGRVTGRTKNYWKVESLTSPYADQGEQPGRTFQIATLESRIYSANNCIRRLIGDNANGRT